jgi:hypothetical protein
MRRQSRIDGGIVSSAPAKGKIFCRLLDDVEMFRLCSSYESRLDGERVLSDAEVRLFRF